MSKVIRKRVSALLMSAVMATSSVAVASGSFMVANAAEGETVNIGKTLATSIPNPDDKDNPLNADKCTYLCKSATDKYTSFTDTEGESPADIYSDSITSLQFNLKSDQMVTDFSYYFGATDTKANGYWWGFEETDSKGAIKCKPYAKEFSVVVELPSSVAKELSSNKDAKFQFQNCYAGLISEEDHTTRTTDAEIELVSITVNGTTDTSNGEKPDWIYEVDPTLPKGAENTGGLNYSSIIGNGKVSDVQENGDNVTVKTINSLKLNDLDIKLTPGDNCSEEYYASDAFKEKNNGVALESETAIRDAGLPLNSHKFTYGDFNFRPGATVADDAKVKSLSVTIKVNGEKGADVNVNRFMYGGGLNVAYKSLADTEYAKEQAGLKGSSGEGGAAKTVGYWYNDIGPEALKQCTDAGVKWGNGLGDFTVGGGTDLAKQELGSYFTVTWDVPEGVVDCETLAEKSQISFQLWYAALKGAKFTDCSIVAAELTYEESITFPCSGTASIKNAGSNSVGDATEIPYADFGMKYDKTADVYAVAFDVTTDQDANEVQFGVGSSALEKADLTDNWFQSDDMFKNEGLNTTTPTLLYWEKSTAGNRPDSTDDSLEDTPYKDAKGTKTYSFMWIVPPTLAEGIRTESTGNTLNAWNQVDTESEDAHMSFGVWYAGLGETKSTKYTINNVTVYYAADDQNNEKKQDMFEDTLEVVDSIDVVLGEKVNLEVNVPNCTGTPDDKTKVGVAADPDNDKILVISGKNVGTTTVKVTTPGGQTKEVTVNVLPKATETTPTVTTTTTTSQTTTTTAKTTTTTATSKTTATTASTSSTTGTTTTEKIIPLYGDVNCDGRVDITDAVLLNKAVAGAVTLESAQQQANSDCDGNGELGSNDAVVLLKFLVALIKSLPSEE